MSKKKRQDPHNQKDYDKGKSDRFWNELRQITAAKPVSSPAPEDPPWLWALSEKGLASYKEWKSKCARDFGHTFTVVTYLYNRYKFKNKSIWESLGEENAVLAQGLCMYWLASHLDVKFNEHKDLLLQAAKADDGKLGSYNSCSYYVCGELEEPIEYHYRLPSLLQEYLFLTDEGKGKPRVGKTVKTLIAQDILRDEHRRNTLALQLTTTYTMVVSYHCAAMTSRNDDQSTPEPFKNLRNKSYDFIYDLLTEDIADTTENFRDLVDLESTKLNYPFICAVAPQLGLKSDSIFWLILQKIYSAIVYEHNDSVFYNITGMGETLGAAIERCTGSIYEQITKILINNIEPLEENAENMRKAQARLDEKIEAADRKVQKANKERDAAIHEAEQTREKLLASERTRSELEQELDALRSLLEQRQETAVVNKDIQDAEPEIQYPIQTKKKVLIYGGHPTWAAPMQSRFPNCQFLNEKNVKNYSGIPTADAVIFQTNALKHSAYNTAKDLANKYNVPILYFDPFKTGVENSALRLAEILASLEHGETA